jgi:basic amino acid/polyamine antiporter, APA family
MDNNQNEGLRREIGVLGVAVNAVNGIVGGGIFLLPALVAAALGSAAMLAYLVCGIMLFAVMLCFAEASSRITVTGGAYAYIENAFGPFAGFIANSFFWFGYGIISDAALANGMADIFSSSIPAFSNPVFRGVFFFLMFGGLAYINIRGVKQGMKIIWVGTVLKLFPLLLLIAAGFFKIKFQNLQWEHMPSAQSLGAVCLFLFFAFQGGEVAVNVGGEMKNPKRTAPLGILSGISTVVIFYILIQLVAQGVLGADLQNHKGAPLVAVAQIVLGPWGATLITLGAIVSIFANMSSSPLLFPRVIFAAAEDKLLPKFLSKLHPKFATPYWAIIVYVIFDFIFSVSGGFKELAVISSASILLVYLGVVLATIKLRLRKNADTKGIFKIPGGLSIPVFAAVVIAWLLIHLSKNEGIAVAIFAVSLSAIYFMSQFLKRKIS